MMFRQARPSEPGAVFLHYGPGTIVNRDAALAACRIDAPTDRLWLRQNPKKKRRRRAASPRERAAFGLPSDTLVIIERLSNGAHARIFVSPDSGAGNPGRQAIKK